MWKQRYPEKEHWYFFYFRDECHYNLKNQRRNRRKGVGKGTIEVEAAAETRAAILPINETKIEVARPRLRAASSRRNQTAMKNAAVRAKRAADPHIPLPAAISSWG